MVPESARQKAEKSKGIKSMLYDARATPIRNNNNNNNERLNTLMCAIRNENPHIPALVALNQGMSQHVETQFGQMPIGSLLSVHLPLMPCDFKGGCRGANAPPEKI